MHPVIESKRVQLAAACQPFGVRRLEVFGSAARDDFDEAHSDLDFLVEFNGNPLLGTLQTYFGLKDALEALFDRPVDLVSRGAVKNPYVAASIDRDRKLLYAA
jgi:predicted nucleotidyltransferase